MSGALRSTTCYNNNADADASASPLLRLPATSPRLPGRRSAAADARSMLLMSTMFCSGAEPLRNHLAAALLLHSRQHTPQTICASSRSSPRPVATLPGALLTLIVATFFIVASSKLPCIECFQCNPTLIVAARSLPRTIRSVVRRRHQRVLDVGGQDPNSRS